MRNFDVVLIIFINVSNSLIEVSIKGKKLVVGFAESINFRRIELRLML